MNLFNELSMRIPVLKKQALNLFFVVLCFCVLILAFQQNQWLKEAGTNQLRAAQRDMALAVTEVLNDFRLSLEDVLLTELSDSQQDPTFVTDYITLPADATLEETQLTRQQLSWLNATQESREKRQRPNSLQLLSNESGQFALLLTEVNTELEKRVRVHVFELDMEEFVEGFVIPFLERELTEFSFHLSLGETYWPNTAALLKADLRFSSNTLGFSPIAKEDETYKFVATRGRPNAPNESNEFQSQDVFFLFESIQRAFKNENLINTPTELIFHISAVGNSLSNTVNRQVLINQLFSWAVLLSLLVTAVSLNIVARRVRAQRQREQEFVATISHELRTPLTVIRSAADNLQAGVVSKPERIARYGEEISRQSQRLDRMIESTLFYSRLESQAEINFQEVNAQTFFEELMQPLTQLASDHHIRLHTEFYFHAKNMTTDANGLRLIVDNLFMNAIIHGKPNEGDHQIWLTITTTANQLTLTLADNGHGITKQEQKSVFQPFVRGQRSSQQQHPGTGLGLNLIQRMVNRLGGRIELQSPYKTPLATEQQGVKFSITLPLKEKTIE